MISESPVLLTCLDSAYGCSDDAALNCLAYAGCEILIETPESVLKHGTRESGGAATALAQNLSGESSKTTVNGSIVTPTTDLSIATLDYIHLSEICNRSYTKAKGIEECKSSCQFYECKLFET